MRPIQDVWLYVDPLAPAVDALAAGVEVSRRSGAALTLVGALGRSEDPMFEASSGEQLLQLVRKDREERLLALEASARAALPPGRVRSILVEGDVPWYSVAARAGEQGPDLLVLGARPGIGSGFDPVSQHLFRKCAVPVWSVRPGRGYPRRALASLQPGAAGSAERRLALGVLEVARRLAGAAPLELHVACAWSAPREELLRPRVGEASTRAYVDALRESAARELQEVLAEAGASVAGVHLERGDPASAIPDLAGRLEADLVLLGSSGRTGLAGLFIGDTAEGIIAQVPCSVLVVKPAGFVSPIRPSRRDRATLVSPQG